MSRWQLLWLGLKDVVMTGAGLVIIFTQVFSTRPSDAVIVAGLALTVPSIAGHGQTVLQGLPAHGGPRSSPPSPSPGPPLPGPPPEGAGEPAEG